MNRIDQNKARLRRTWYQARGISRAKALTQLKSGKITIEQFYRLKEAGSWNNP